MSERWPEKIIVGLTGNIATGKSTVMRLAEDRGALALDADMIVHEILSTDPGAQRAVVDAFGPVARQPDGAIDRAAVAAIVFNDEEALRTLEQILHPRVRRRLLKEIDRCPETVVLIEAIKLLEGDLAAECDQIWVTRCPVATQVQRLVTYRNLDEESALMRINAQSSQELKAAAADVIIDTGGTIDQTRAYFELAWDRLQRRRSSGETLTDTTDQKVDAASKPKEEKRAESTINPAAETSESRRPLETRNYAAFGQGIVVRRARPADIPVIIDLASQASHGTVALEHDQLLNGLGQRGYLIGQQGDDISAIAGWNADNLVATIDCIYIHPSEAIAFTGAAVLQEIEVTANELICEIILALPGASWPAELRRLLTARGFKNVVPESLPRVWSAAVADAPQPAKSVMLKVLRDTRQVHVRTIKEHDG